MHVLGVPFQISYANLSNKKLQLWAVAQLREQSLPRPEIHSWNQVINNFHLLSTVLNTSMTKMKKNGWK